VELPVPNGLTRSMISTAAYSTTITTTLLSLVQATDRPVGLCHLQALLPVIRESLYLTRHDVGNAGIAAVCGAIASRVMMGNMVDMYGPRYGFSFLLLLTAPAIYCMALVTSEF